VGGEVGLAYVFTGHSRQKPSQLPPGFSMSFLEDGHVFYTTAAVVLRWFIGHRR
jgi:hypothetical protein